MVRKFFCLKSALSNIKDPEFLILHECDIPYDGGVRKREYYVFRNITEYLMKMDEYPHSHEVIYRDSDGIVTGRLMFDFDFKKTKIENDFENVIEELIFTTINTFYTDINESAITPVWQITDHNNKYSRHLTVKGFVFDGDWVLQSKIFYELLLFVIKRSHKLDYIKDEKIIDDQIAKENTTMRMPSNRKINGNPLYYKEKGFNFYDGLIKLYKKEDMFEEQSIKDNYNIPAIRQYAPEVYQKYFNLEILEKNKVKIKTDLANPDYIQRTVCKIISSKLDNLFEISKIDGQRIDLIRKKPGECPIDKNQYHEHENAFLFYDEKTRKFRFFCRRGCTCNNKKYKDLIFQSIMY